MESFTELYTPADLSRLRRRRIIFLALCWVFALGGLFFCVLCCLRTGTENAAAMLRYVLTASTLCGWVCISLRQEGIEPTRREREHTAHMLSGERETLHGLVTVAEETVQIRRSIAVRTVLLRSGDETRRLSIHAPRAKALGPTPREMTLVTVHNYVAAFSAGESDAGVQARASARPRIGGVLKRIVASLHRYILWLLISVFLWGWIFSRITDTAPAKKVTLFVDAYAVEDTALAAALERGAPDGIRMVKVHPFSYAMFEAATLRSADIYIVKESAAAQYLEAFGTIEPTGGGVYYAEDGAVWGVRVYDAAAGVGAADSYILYCPEGALPEDYYLFFGRESLHTGALDDAAYRIAELLMELE